MGSKLDEKAYCYSSPEVVDGRSKVLAMLVNVLGRTGEHITLTPKCKCRCMYVCMRVHMVVT